MLPLLLLAQTTQSVSPLRSWSFWEKPLQGAIQWVGVGILGWLLLQARKLAPKLSEKSKPHRDKIRSAVGEVVYVLVMFFAALNAASPTRKWALVSWVLMFLAIQTQLQLHWLGYLKRRVQRNRQILDEMEAKANAEEGSSFSPLFRALYDLSDDTSFHLNDRTFQSALIRTAFVAWFMLYLALH